jgi:hypothetical protein
MINQRHCVRIEMGGGVEYEFLFSFSARQHKTQDDKGLANYVGLLREGVSKNKEKMGQIKKYKHKMFFFKE